MFMFIKSYWIKLPSNVRRHIVSALVTFVSTALLTAGAQIALGFPKSWVEWSALLMVVLRFAVKAGWETMTIK